MVRKKRSWSLFEEFERMRRIMEGMVEEMFKDFEELEKIKGKGSSKVIGYTVEIGPEGRVRVREFGDVKPTLEGLETGKEELVGAREPLVEVHEDGEELVIVAEVPGIKKEDIELNLIEDDLLELKVDTPSRRYYKKLKLPALVDEKSIRATYKNGILEVRIRIKQRKQKETKKRIKVE